MDDLIKIRKGIKQKFLLRNKKLRKRFLLYNFSLDQKYSSYQYYYDRVITIHPNQYREVRIITKGKNDRSENYQEVKPINRDKYIKTLNRLLDSYFFCTVSFLDTLTHKVNVMFKIQSVKKNLYINSIIKNQKFGKKFKTVTPGIYKIFSDFIKSREFKYLDYFRNITTHESVIANELETSYDFLESAEIVKPIFLKYNNKKVEMQNLIKIIDKKINKFQIDLYNKILKQI